MRHNYYPRYLWRNDKKINLEGNDRGRTGKQYSHDLLEAEALGFIKANKDRPFFLYVPFTIPHVALQVPEDSLKEYHGKWDDPPYKGGKGYLPHDHPRAAYAAMVSRMDRSVGRIFEQLQSSVWTRTRWCFSAATMARCPAASADRTRYFSTQREGCAG